MQEKQLHLTINGKLSQSRREKVFFIKKAKEQKFETIFFLSYKIIYFKNSATDTTLSQKFYDQI